jgi:tetratricopeptide (TPR) repeat protein
MLIGLSFKLHSMWESHVEDTALDQIKQGNSLLNAGDTASLNKSVDTYKKAIATLQGMHNPLEMSKEGIATYNMAKAYGNLKQYPLAIETAQHALTLFTADKSKEDRADVNNSLGLYYIKTDQPDKAMDAYKQAEPLYHELGKTEKEKAVINVEGALLFDQAVSDAKKKDWPGARDACIQSQKRYQEAGKPESEADALHELGLIYIVMGDSAKAAGANAQEKALRDRLPATSGK